MKKTFIAFSFLISQASFASYVTCDFDGWTFRENDKKILYATDCFVKTPGSNLFCRKAIGTAAKVGPGARSQHIPYASYKRDSREGCESEVNVDIKFLKENYKYTKSNIMGVLLYKFYLE